MVRTARGLEDAVWQSIALRPMHCNRQTVCTPLHMACGRDEYNWGGGGGSGPDPPWSQKRSQYLVTKKGPKTGRFGQPSARTCIWGEGGGGGVMQQHT